MGKPGSNTNLSPDMFSGFSQEFQSFVGELLLSERIEVLEHLVDFLIKNKKADDDLSAYQLINEVLINVTETLKETDIDPNVGDLTGKAAWLSKLAKSLRDSVGKDSDVKMRQYRVIGTLSHFAILEFFSTKIPDYKFLRRLIDEGNFLVQKTIFDAGKNVEKNKLKIRKSRKGFLQEIVDHKGFLSTFYINQLKLCWTAISRVGVYESIDKRVSESSSKLEILEDLLYPIFGELIDNLKLKCAKDEKPDYLYLVSLMTWASAVIYRYGNNARNKVVFNEIPSLSKRFGAVGGSIDGLEIVSVNGRPLTKNQYSLISSMGHNWQNVKNKSVGYLVKEILQIFNNVELKLLELKFAAGDAISNSIIEPTQVAAGAFKQHHNQVLRYLALANWDIGALLFGSGEKGLERCLVKEATIVYYFPFHPPLEYEISLDPASLQKAFFGQVVSRWVNAKKRTFRRLMIGNTVKELLGVKNGNGKSNGKNGTKVLVADETPLLSGSKEEVISLNASIINSRKFLDKETQIIEVISSTDSDKPHFVMHYDKLLEAINNGKVVARKDFNANRGGFICCPIDDHKEKTPSFSVDLKRTPGRFKCFGFSCHIGGKILQSSIPSDVKIEIMKVATTKRTFSKQGKAPEVILPDRHFEVMKLAQRFLLEGFKEDKRGQAYLKEDRKLKDMKLARKLRIGFGDQLFIKKMLEAEVTYEELVYYGFLGFSKKIKPHFTFGLCPILQKEFGMTVEEMQRKNTYGDVGLPFSVLDRRITAPLSLPDGKITSLYGRAVWTSDRTRIHRKLKSDQVGFLHGAVNMEALNSDCPTIVLNEGLADMYSLALMGAPEVMSFIGVKNEFIIEAVAKSKKENIWIGFDNDPSRIEDDKEKGKTGQKATQLLIKELKERGFKGEVHDLTAKVVEANPGVEFKDFNDLWKITPGITIEDLIF